MQLRSDIIKEALTMLLLMSACMSPHFITPQATNTTIMKNGSQALLTFPGTANVITIKEFNGTYGSSGTSCEGHADNDPWSLSVNGYGGTLTNPVLTVAKGDTDCVLTATSVAGQYTGSGTPDPGTIFTPASAGNFPFTTNNYAGAALAFQSSGTTDFYGNMLITDHTFSGAFTMTLTTSDDPGAITPAVTATYNTVQTITGTASLTPAPAYIATSTPIVYTDVNKYLSSNSTGNLVLHTSGQAGEYYEVVPISNNSTISAPISGVYDKVNIDNAWNNSTNHAGKTAVSGNITLSLTGATTTGAGFGYSTAGMGSGGTALTSAITQYVLIQHTDTNAGTITYEVVVLSIASPTG